MRIASSLLLALAALIDPARIAFNAQKADKLEWTPFIFTTDSGESTDAERAVIVVPERHGKSGGATIKLPLIRFRTKATHPGAPVVYIAGGPGGSGLVSGKRDLYFPAAMAFWETADVIFYDQRGTGTAEPSLNFGVKFDVPSNALVGSDIARAAFRKTADSVVKLTRTKGIDLDAYNSVENADDLESIRVALGADKMSLWGHSYGSHLALAYMKRHGAHVSRVILGGINGLDQRWRYPSEGETWLRTIDAATRQDARLRASMSDFIGTTRRVIEKLEANPIHVNVSGQDVVIGADEIRTMFVLQGGESDFVKRLPLLIANLDRGEATPYAPLVQGVLRNRTVGTAMTYSMHIASGVSPKQLDRIKREVPGTILRDAINYPFSDDGFRTAWGVTDLGEAYRASVVSSIRVLLISGTLDGRTSIAAARDVRKGLKNASQVTVRGAAHDIYGETPVLIDRMKRFMNGERLRDTTIDVATEFHGPDEPALTAEIHSIAVDKGVEAAIARAKDRRIAPNADLTSYVLENVAGVLDRTDKRPQDAIAILRAGTEMFPSNPVLNLRLGGALLAAGDKAGAVAAYRRAVSLNPLLRFGVVQLGKLGG